MKSIKAEKRETIAFVVPTGIGASIGGFAGDASVYARKFAKKFNVIVNPNVVNAACFSGVTDNMIYLEGWAMSRFFAGDINLLPQKSNKIGVVFDKAIPHDVLNIHLNTINAVKTIYGIDIVGYEVTKEACGIEFFKTQTGISSGSLTCPETLKDAGKKLMDRGATALAIVCLFPEPVADDIDYENGVGVDVVGGVEAIISHYISKELFISSAHAPAFNDYTIKTDLVSPKVAAEYITPTFLPCILLGLQLAPKFLHANNHHVSNSLNIKDLKALIMPYNCLGSSIVVDALKNNIKIYAIKENSSVLRIDKNALILHNMIVEVGTYDLCLEILEKN